MKSSNIWINPKPKKRRRLLRLIGGLALLTVVGLYATKSTFHHSSEQSTIQTNPSQAIASEADVHLPVDVAPKHTQMPLRKENANTVSVRDQCIEAVSKSNNNSETVTAAESANYLTLRRKKILALLTDTEPERVAIGLFLNITGRKFEDTTCSPEVCTEEALVYRRKESLSRLADIAVHSNSTLIYTMAQAACKQAGFMGGLPNHCQMITARRYAQIAPDTAWAWLQLAKEAKDNGDLSAQEAAMHKASTATDWGDVSTKFKTATIRTLKDEDLNSALGVLTIDFEHGAELLSTANADVWGYCKSSQSAEKHDICLKLSNNMLDRVDSLRNLSTGLALAKSSGNNAPKVEALTVERDHLAAAIRIPTENSRIPSDYCVAIEERIDLHLKIQENGELAALRVRFPR